MKRFFKISLLILIIVLCMGVFVACGEDKSASTDNNNTNVNEDNNIVQKTEAELMAEDLEEIKSIISNKYAEVYNYSGIGNEYYVYGKSIDGNVVLDVYVLSSGNTTTHEGLQAIITELRTASAENVADFSEGAEYQIEDYIYGNPANGATPFTEAAGITATDIVSVIKVSRSGEYTYTCECIVAGGSQTYKVVFETEISGRPTSDAEIYTALLNTTPAVSTISIELDISKITTGKDARKVNDDPEPDPEQHTHSYTDEVIDPTCTEKGYTKHTCACGETYNDAETSALGHNFIDGVCTRCEAKDPDYVAELDFSGLEEKLETVITSESKYNSVNEILGYWINDGKLIVAFDWSWENKNNTFITVYEANIDSELDTQNEINEFVKNFNKNNFTGVVSIIKTKSDITIGDDTYSKDGIEGDNVFAEQCGVTEGAILTYVSSMGTQVYAETYTGYGRRVRVLTIYEKDDEWMVNFSEYVVESQSSYTSEQLYTNLITEGKHYDYVYGTQTVIEMGENLKK